MSEHHHAERVPGCFRCEDSADDEAAYVLEAVIDRFMPRSLRTLRGNGWVLTRENDDE